MDREYIEVKSCPECGSDSRGMLYKGNLDTDHVSCLKPENYTCTAPGLARYFDILKCNECGLIYSAIRPDEGRLTRLYRDVVDELYLREEEGRYKTFSRALKKLNALCPDRGRLLEFGSYTGIFFELAEKAGWDVQGIELSDWCRAAAEKRRGLRLLPEYNGADEFPEGRFDAVVMWDVIEHLPRPAPVIERAGRLLKNGGILGLSTIDLGSPAARILRGCYPFLMEMHLVYFTKKSISKLLKKYGFEMIIYKRHRRYISLGYLAEKIFLLNFLRSNNFLWKFLKRRYFRFSMGIRDIYARKVY